MGVGVMRGAVLLFTLAASLAEAQESRARFFDRVCPRTPGGRSTRGLGCESSALFEFAPASGAGMGAACAGTIPTSAGGLAGTYTHAGTMECSKQGLATAGIADGDLVLLTANQPRVEPSGGILGVRHEEARSNSIIRSNEFENVAWSLLGTGVAAPTVTANYGPSPRGTTTAERLQLAAATGANQSLIFQPANCGTGGDRTASVYVRSLSGSGTTALCINTGSVVCGSCSFVDTSWSRCVFTANVVSNGTWILGNNSVVTGVTYSAYDLLVWGAQCEVGADATSFIETTSAAASRLVETGITYTVPAIGPAFCVAASVQFQSSSVGVANIVNGSGTGGFSLYRQSNTEAGYAIDATLTAPTVSAIGTTVHRTLLRDDSTETAFWDAVSVTAPSAVMAGTATTIRIGAGSPAVPTNGIVTRVQVDNDVTRCTP